MLGRNCGCSWWFEVRRDWPRVTLNKYTRTSQEGAGRLRLPPNHPWLISWQIQGDFLCTLPTTTIPSPNQPPLPPTPKPMEGDGIGAAQRGQSRQPGRWSFNHTLLPLQKNNTNNKHTHMYMVRCANAQIWLHTAPCHSSSDQLLQLVVSY